MIIMTETNNWLMETPLEKTWFIITVRSLKYPNFISMSSKKGKWSYGMDFSDLEVDWNKEFINIHIIPPNEVK